MVNEFFFLNQSIHKKMQSGVSILSTFVQFLCFTQFGGSSHRLSFDKFAAQLLKRVEFVYRILSWGLLSEISRLKLAF